MTVLTDRFVPDQSVNDTVGVKGEVNKLRQRVYDSSVTFTAAQAGLIDMEAKRDDLNDAINELKDQLKWGAEMMASMGQPQKAAG